MTRKQLRSLLDAQWEAARAHALAGATQDPDDIRERADRIRSYTLERLWLELKHGQP